MEAISLQAEKREISGKKNRFLRRKGVTPIHLFGGKAEPQSLQCDTIELKRIIAKAGRTRLIHLKVSGDRHQHNTFIREIQIAEPGSSLIHVDFYQISKGEKIKLEIPVILVGEAPGLKTKGRILTHGINVLHIESQVETIPAQIEVDITVLAELDQALHVKDIVLDPAITVLTDKEQLVVKISEIRVARVEEVVAAAPTAEGAAAPAEGAEGAKAPAGEKAEGGKAEAASSK
jgi:large subunit ribosomal protein L25